MRLLVVLLTMVAGWCLATEEPMEVRWFTFLPAHFACAMRAYVDLDAEARKTPEERAAEAARRRAEEVSDWKRWLSELGDVTRPEGSSLVFVTPRVLDLDGNEVKFE